MSEYTIEATSTSSGEGFVFNGQRMVGPNHDPATFETLEEAQIEFDRIDSDWLISDGFTFPQKVTVYLIQTIPAEFDEGEPVEWNTQTIAQKVFELNYR